MTTTPIQNASANAPTSALKTTLLALMVVTVTLASITVLWFLYQKTQVASPEIRLSIDENLRNLRQLDAEWNVDVLRSKVGINTGRDTTAEPLAKINAAQDRLTAIGLSNTPQIKAQLEALRKTFALKAEYVEAFKAHNTILRNSLRSLPTAANEARAALTGHANADLLTQLNTTLDEALRYAVAGEDTQRDTVQTAVTQLAGKLDALPVDTLAQTAAETFLSHVRAIMRQKSNEENLLSDVSNVSTVTQIDSATQAYQTVFNLEQNNTNFWRTALLGYSAFLLALVGFIAWRLRKSYVEINRVNTQLVAANDNLEQRVQERTQALGQALTSLKESEAQLIQSEKMSSLGQMIAGVAHEINTPLAYVRSSLETVGDHMGEVDNLVKHTHNLLDLMAASEPDAEQLSASYTTVSSLTSTFNAHGIVQEMQKLSKDGLYGLDQISEIVINLRNFSRLDRSKTTVFNLREGLDSTLVIARNVIKQHEVVKRYGDIPAIECSPSQLNQVFLNLITNAAQALPAVGGRILLTTSRVTEPVPMVRIDVADNGSGIAPEHLEKIFEPFFTTKEVGKGTGLGLSIAYKIMQEHGGRIEVKSKIGKGTVFSLYLPEHSTTIVQPPAHTA